MASHMDEIDRKAMTFLNRVGDHGCKSGEVECLDDGDALLKVSDLVIQAVLATAYARGLVPEEQFTLEGTTSTLTLCLNTPSFKAGGARARGDGDGDALDDDAGATTARALQALLTGGVRESIANKYLKSLVLSINNAEGLAVEQYHYRLTYPTSSRITFVRRARAIRLSNLANVDSHAPRRFGSRRRSPRPRPSRRTTSSSRRTSPTSSAAPRSRSR